MQPTQNTANIVGWAEFTFDFVTSGGAVPAVGAGTAVLPGTVWATSFDTDAAGTLREFVEFVGGGVTVADTGLSAGTTLSASAAVAGGVQYQSGTVGQADITTDNTYKGSALYTNPSTFKLVYGARTGTSGSTAGPRLTAFDFFRPDAVLLRPVVGGYKSVRLTTDTNGDGIVNPGDRVTYTVTYVNTGNAPASAVQINDPLPAGTVLTATGGQTVRVNGTVTAAARNLNYTGTGANTGLLAANQSLAAGGTISVDIPVTVANAATGAVENRATASATGLTLPGSDAVDTTTTFPPSVSGAAGWPGVPAGSFSQTQTGALDPAVFTVVPQADLTITKTGPASAVAGTEITYLLTLSNAGPSAANAATFSDNVPGGLTGVTATCQNPAGGAGGCTLTVGSGNTVTGSVASFPSGGRVEVLIRGTVPPGATATLTNAATLRVPAGTTDPTSTAGTNTSETVTTTLTRTADLSVTKTDNLSSVISGQTLSYTIVVTNAGPSTTTASFADTTFSGVALSDWTCAPTSGGATCPTGLPASGGYSAALSLPAGSSLTFRVTGRVTAASGSASNTATLGAPGGTTDPAPGNNSATDTTTVQAAVIAPRLTKTVQNVTPTFVSAAGQRADGLPGQTLEYCIAFENRGNVALPDFRVSDTLPGMTTGQTNAYGAGQGLRIVRGGVTTYLPFASPVEVNLGTLAVNESGNVCFQVKIN